MNIYVILAQHFLKEALILTQDQILIIGKLFTDEAKEYKGYLSNLMDFDNGYRHVGHAKLDRVGSNSIVLSWDLCSSYAIVAIREIDVGFNKKLIAKYVIGAKFPMELDREYLKYELIYKKFIEIVENNIEPPATELAKAANS